MIHRDSWLTIRESVLESAKSLLESAGCSIGSSTDLVKISMCVWALSLIKVL